MPPMAPPDKPPPVSGLGDAVGVVEGEMTGEEDVVLRTVVERVPVFVRAGVEALVPVGARVVARRVVVSGGFIFFFFFFGNEFKDLD